MDAKKYLHTEEAAKYIGVSRATLERWRRQSGDVPRWRRIGKRRVVYAVEWLDEYVNRESRQNEARR
jgi:excisionase family DNA binding protein